MPLRNPLSALLDYASARGDEASSIGSVMTQLARPILVSQGVETGATPPAPPAKVGGGVPAAPLPQTTSDAQEYYIREFGKRGLSRPVSEGIVAGMGSESGLNPAINERNPTVPGSRGGFGLYQLTGPRRIAFERWASENGKNVNDDQAQIDFMMTEFAGPERKAYDALIQAPDAQSAATIFTDQFLRPGVSHATQSANEAARMSGQPYDPAMAGAGAMAATGGALPQTVEGILSSLYPDSTETEKAAHRKDIWRGLSQGLSALSQGGQVDLSNIAANADERRRQNVLDMRERERARAGAALIYSQTGDADMAGAVAGGLMSLNDVFSERERKRLAEQADAQRLKTEQANEALGGLVLGMTADLGLGEKRTAEVAAALDAGADPSTVLTLNQQAKLADEARKKEEQAAAAAETRASVAEEYAASEDPLLRLTGQLLLSDPKMTVAEGYKLASDRFPVAKEGGDKGFEFQAKIIARMNAFGEDEATATRAVLEQDQKDGNVSGIIIRPDGTVTINPAATGAPAATGSAPATPAVTGGAPAATGIAGAFEAQFGKPEEGTVTTTNDKGEIVNVPIPGAIAPQQALADLEAQLQANREKAATETDTLALSTLNVEAADLKNQQLAAQIAQVEADKTVDAQTKQANLANLKTQAMTAKLDYDNAVATADKAKADAAAASSSEYLFADRQFAVADEAAKEIFKNGLDFWTTGMGGKVYTGLLGGIVQQTDRTSFLATVATLGSQAMFDALKEAKDAGVTLVPVTNLDLTSLGSSVTRLAKAEELKGEVIVKDAAALMNYTRDALYGPKDLMRYDEFGQPYQVGQNTLGVTEDTFARHWMSIPPDVKEAWKAGEITDLPTDNPAYKEAANVINAMTKNFELYQGPVDRSVVGMAEPPASGSFEPPPADLPVPNNITAEQWPSVWAELSPADQAKYIQQNGGGN